MKHVKKLLYNEEKTEKYVESSNTLNKFPTALSLNLKVKSK